MTLHEMWKLGGFDVFIISTIQFFLWLVVCMVGIAALFAVGRIIRWLGTGNWKLE